MSSEVLKILRFSIFWKLSSHWPSPGDFWCSIVLLVSLESLRAGLGCFWLFSITIGQILSGNLIGKRVCLQEGFHAYNIGMLRTLFLNNCDSEETQFTLNSSALNFCLSHCLTSFAKRSFVFVIREWLNQATLFEQKCSYFGFYWFFEHPFDVLFVVLLGFRDYDFVLMVRHLQNLSEKNLRRDLNFPKKALEDVQILDFSYGGYIH